ncbi:ECF transporter S component, partial [Bifidobacteriaceae bacterium WP022]
MGISNTNNHQTYAKNSNWSSEKIAKYALFVALS